MVSVAFRFVPAAHIFHIGSVQRVYASWAGGNFVRRIECGDPGSHDFDAW